MPNALGQNGPAFRAALLEHQQQERVSTGKIAAALVVFLMPAGIILDRYYDYARDHGFLGYFLGLRLACSALAALIWFLFTTPFGRRHYRLLGLPIAWLPAAFISWMILVTQGEASPYYAGLNLILLAVSAVVHWSTRESIVAVIGVLAMYGAACFGAGEWTSKSMGGFVNNVYFITLTGIIVVVGNHIFNRLQLSEFSAGYELKQNRQKLEETNQKLVELDQIKSRLFANISHELRTPLTLLLAPLDRLIELQGQSSDQANRDLLVTMRLNGMRLLKLINDLLDLVRLESGRMEVKREPLEVGQFIRGLASAARHVAIDRHIELETCIDPSLGVVLADRDKLEKIILNLVFNALKFTPVRGRVEVRAQKADGQIVFVVSDTGMGIAEKNLPFIFDRFWQADTSSNRKYQGAGIGLALVKELVELQGGQVAVQSQEGKGTTFTISVPYLAVGVPSRTEAMEHSADALSKTSAEAEPKSEEWLANLYRRAELFPAVTLVQDAVRPVESLSNGNHLRILVADDEPDMLRFLKSQLSGHYQVLEAVDGQQAVEKGCQFLPDLILLDMMMPEKDGLQACRELRECTSTQSIPIVLLTARADEETKMAALSAGASDFLAKPFSTTELHVRIKNLIESHGYQTRLAKQNQVLEHTIDQLKETETQLVESEKMRSLGQLSAGMIHEINNPLNFATTGLFTLRSKAKLLAAEQQAEYLEMVDDVEEGVKRVKDLVSKMREFSYADNRRVEQVELSQVLTSALRFLSHEWKGKVEVQQQVSDGQHIWANKTRMTQVLLNLLQNSLDALARKPFQGEKPTISIASRAEPDRTVLVIRDNGDGIDPNHLDKVFDPFFTTKEVGEGMGLGLSICYRIVRDYGGRIQVRSELGKFCEFRLEFPTERPPEESIGFGSGDQYARST
jgi:signal transduction histidine kinase